MMLSTLDLPREQRILIVGYGDLGKRIANGLVHQPHVAAVGVVGRDPETVGRDANLLRFTSMNHGWHGHVEAFPADLEQAGSVAAALRAFEPTIVVNAASVQSWRRLAELPKSLFTELDEAQFGPWLPMHLAPATSLMAEVRETGREVVVVNAAFPDAVGPALAAHGLAPTLGAGNVANVVPALRWASARVLGLPAAELEVRVVAQHYYSHRLPRFGDSGEGAAALEVRHHGEPVSLADGLRERVELSVSTYCRRTGGVEGQSLTASSVASVLRALASEEPVLVHAPAPAGLPGGYPVHVSRTGIALALPDGLSRDEAVRINERGQWADGISHIDASDGAATLRSELVAILQKRFPVDDAPVRPQPSRPALLWERARELGAAFAAFRADREVAA